MKAKECVAMILAGGQGSRLGILTKNVAKPAVPFGGKYRIIDFPLSNCTHSGIDTGKELVLECTDKIPTQTENHAHDGTAGKGGAKQSQSC